MDDELKRLAGIKSQVENSLIEASEQLENYRLVVEEAGRTLDQLEIKRRSILAARDRDMDALDSGSSSSISQATKLKKQLREVVDAIEERKEFIQEETQRVDQHVVGLSLVTFEDAAHVATITFWRTAFKKKAFEFRDKHTDYLNELSAMYQMAELPPYRHDFASGVLFDGGENQSLEEIERVEDIASVIENWLIV
jgi:hypothetical protein